jgi:hypothetical protein
VSEARTCIFYVPSPELVAEAILSSDFAFQELRQSDLDFLEANDLPEELKTDPSAFHIANMWVDHLEPNSPRLSCRRNSIAITLFTRECWIADRYGLKGALVVAELIKVLEARRGHTPSKMTAGSVNVEAGAQAIVGTVESRQLQDNVEPRGLGDVVEPSEPKAIKR